MKLKKTLVLAALPFILSSCLNGKVEVFVEVTFDANGGLFKNRESYMVIKVHKGDKLSYPDVPYRLGYDLKNWKNGNDTWSFSDDIVTSNIALTAAWNILTYSISYSYDGDAAEFGYNSGINNPTSYTIETPTFTLKKPVNSAFEISDWKDEDDNVIKEIECGSTGDLALHLTISKKQITEGEILFGSYPQSEVTDPDTLGTLFSMVEELPSNENSHKWTPYNWYIQNSNATKYAWYIDLDSNYDGIKDYRGVYFTSFRPYIASSTSQVNCPQADNGYYESSVYFFKYEPIEWKVLDSNNGSFVISNKILDVNQYSILYTNTMRPKTDYQGNTEEVYPNNYKYSDLRTFLNVDFYNLAFSSPERYMIQDSVIDNSDSSCSELGNQYACENTIDKVFTLSYKEITDPSLGFSETYTGYDRARNIKATDYASCMGCRTYGGTPHNGYGYYWLRSPYMTNSTVANSVNSGGSIMLENYIFRTDCGIVPALYLK